MRRIFSLALYESKHFFINWFVILICTLINLFINYMDLKGKQAYVSTAFFLNNTFNTRVSISFLMLFFIMIPFFYKDKSYRMKELVESMQVKNYELGISRWLAAVLGGIVFVAVNMVVIIGILQDKFYDFNLLAMLFDLLYAYTPMIILAASLSYALSIIFKKPLMPFLIGTIFSVIVVDYLNYIPVMHIFSVASLYQFFQLDYSEILAFDPDLPVLIYNVVFNTAISILILFTAILFQKGQKEDRRWQQCIAAISVAAIGFAMLGHNQLYISRQNSFHQKLQAVDIFNKTAEKDKAATTLESIKLNLNIKRNNLFAKGQIIIRNISDKPVQMVVFNLGENLTIDSLKAQGAVLSYSRKGFMVEAKLAAPLQRNASATLDIAYHGGVMEWKRVDNSYYGYEPYSYITSNCMYLAPNTGWYPQTASSPIYISEQEEIFEQSLPKSLQTININTEDIKPFDIEVNLENAPYKTLFSNEGKVDNNIIYARACEGLFIYGAELENYSIGSRQYYTKKGHDVYINDFEEELKKRVDFFSDTLSPYDIATVVELPDVYNTAPQIASNRFKGIFVYEEAFYGYKRRPESVEDWMTKEALRSWIPALDNSNIFYKAFDGSSTKLTYENVLADYLVYLYKQSGESHIDVQRKLTDQLRNQAKKGRLSSAEQNRTENAKLLYKYLDRISVEENMSSFARAVKSVTDITKARRLTDEDILKVVGDQ